VLAVIKTARGRRQNGSLHNHTGFTSEFFRWTNNPGQWVGAIALRAPIGKD